MEKRFATYVIVLALLLGGCAHSLDKFYWSDGQRCAFISSYVIGTGNTAKVIQNPCVVELYDTSDTGISDNGVKMGSKIAEGLAKGAVKGIVPVP